MADVARLGIVLVNWNGWADTLERLETLLRSTIPARIVVVDNASTDGSSCHIADWAAGAIDATASATAFAAHSSPGAAKAITLRRLDAATAVTAAPDHEAVTLIDAGGNLGFAGGNNVGLRFLFRDPAIDYVWLLNNDSVVEPAAAAAVVARMHAAHDIGMCGTVVRYYHRPRDSPGAQRQPLHPSDRPVARDRRGHRGNGTFRSGQGRARNRLRARGVVGGVARVFPPDRTDG